MDQHTAAPDPHLLYRMNALVKQWQASGDNRHIFLHCYTLMTNNMLVALDGGRFDDDGWVSHLLHHFAGYYFDALERYDQADTGLTPVWRYAYDACGRERLFAAQHLLLGVNAHINYDLVLALSDLLQPEWASLDEAQRRARYADHCRVNTIIAETVDVVQDEVLEEQDPWMDLVDRLAGRLDEWAASRMISGWRGEVWEQAVRMVEAPTSSEREAVRRHVEHDALRWTRLILGNLDLDSD